MPHFTEDELVSYVLGMLSPGRASEIAKLAESDPELATQISVMRGLVGWYEPAKSGGYPGRAWVIVVAFLLLVTGIGAGGGGYYLADRARSELVTELQALRQQLGLREPVKTEGFVLRGPDTLVLTAEINKRSIKRVLFRPLPGEEEVVYEAEQPRDGTITVRARKIYDRYGPAAGKRITTSVEFVPFDDLPADLLPPKDDLLKQQEILVSPVLGIVLDPSDPVRLNLPEAVSVRGTDYEVQGVSFREGWLVVLVRPVGAGGPWYVQNLGRSARVRAGHFFFVPCKFHKAADEFEIAAVVVPSDEDSPFPAGKSEVDPPVPDTDLKGRHLEKFGPVRVTVIRPNP